MTPAPVESPGMSERGLPDNIRPEDLRPKPVVPPEPDDDPDVYAVTVTVTVPQVKAWSPTSAIGEILERVNRALAYQCDTAEVRAVRVTPEPTAPTYPAESPDTAASDRNVSA